MRNAVSLLAAVLVFALAGCSGSNGTTTASTEAPSEASQAEAPAPSSEPTASDEPSAAPTPEVSDQLDDECADAVNEDQIPGDLFARCLVDATVRADTAIVTTVNDDGSSATGPMSAAPPLALHFTLDSGDQILINGDQGWLNQGGQWVDANPDGTMEESLAALVVGLYQGLTLPTVQEQWFASSPTWTLDSGDTEVINGVTTVPYSGTPDAGEVSIDEYVIWVDAQFLPRRLDATSSVAGFSGTTRQEFAEWGAPVTIPHSP